MLDVGARSGGAHSVVGVVARALLLTYLRRSKLRMVEGMTSRCLLVAAVIAVPVGVHAERAKPVDADTGAQFASSLMTASDGDGAKTRAPTLAYAAPAKAESPGARPAGPEAPKLAVPGVVAPPKIYRGDKSETTGALQPKPAPYQPARSGAGAMMRTASVGHAHRAMLVSYDPARAAMSDQVDNIVRSWKANLKWNEIAVDGYAAGKRSTAENRKLGQQRADQVRAYLIHRGVPGELVIAVGHADEPAQATRAKIEISVTTCDGVTIPCRQPSPSK